MLDDIQGIRIADLDLFRLQTETRSAIDRKDIIFATDHISRFLSKPTLPAIQSLFDSPSTSDLPVHLIEVVISLLIQNPIDNLKLMQHELLLIIVERFDEAVRSSDPEGVTISFKQFPRIGKASVGLDKLATYLCSVISRNVHEALGKAVESGTKTMYLDTLVLLFESVALMIDRQEDIIETHYGIIDTHVFLTRLSVETDIQSCILLNGLIEARQLDRKVVEIERWNRGRHRGNIDVEVKEVDVVLGGF